jgi:hypothetical protein
MASNMKNQKGEEDPVSEAVFYAMDEEEGVVGTRTGNSSTNNNNSITNQSYKRMTLKDAQEELERQGFISCDNESTNTKLLVGVLSECRWSLTAKIDVMVFVHQVDGVLTAARLAADRLALPDLINDHFVGGCPPFGFARAVQVMVIYYAETIDPVATTMIRQWPRAEFCRTTFLAAQDGAGKSYYLEYVTPFWGKAYYPEMQYRAGRLTGRPLDGPVPGVSRWIMFANAFIFLYLVFLVLFMWSSSHTMIYVIIAFEAAFFLVAAIVQWYKHLSTRRCQPGQQTNHGQQQARLVQQQEEDAPPPLEP